MACPSFLSFSRRGAARGRGVRPRNAHLGGLSARATVRDCPGPEPVHVTSFWFRAAPQAGGPAPGSRERRTRSREPRRSLLAGRRRGPADEPKTAFDAESLGPYSSAMSRLTVARG